MIQLFKKGTGQMSTFDPYSFQSLLDSGEWFLTRDDALSDRSAPEAQEEPEAGEEEPAIVRATDGKSDDELRAMGKEANIRNWHNMKIDNLRAKLNDTES